MPRATATATRRVSPSFFPSLSLSLSPFLRAQKRLSSSPEPDDAVSKSGARTREKGTRERERVGDQVSSVKKKSHCTGASDRGVGR